jgi:hypothetical protein
VTKSKEGAIFSLAPNQVFMPDRYRANVTTLLGVTQSTDREDFLQNKNKKIKVDRAYLDFLEQTFPQHNFP